MAQEVSRDGKLARSWIVFGITATVAGDFFYFLAAVPLGLRSGWPGTG